MRWFLRAPIGIYKAGLGFLLGGRFLMVTHTGRKSGLPRDTVVEVVHHDEAADTYYVCSGFGPNADWYRNIQKTPEVTLHVKSRVFRTTARNVDAGEEERVLAEYAARNPVAWRNLSKAMLGETLSASPEDIRRLAERAPMLAFPARSQPDRQA